MRAMSLRICDYVGRDRMSLESPQSRNQICPEAG